MNIIVVGVATFDIVFAIVGWDGLISSCLVCFVFVFLVDSLVLKFV